HRKGCDRAARSTVVRHWIRAGREEPLQTGQRRGSHQYADHRPVATRSDWPYRANCPADPDMNPAADSKEIKSVAGLRRFPSAGPAENCPWSEVCPAE